jgi:hypothetical protein
MLRWIIFIVIYIAIDIYAFQALRTVSRNQWIYGGYITISIAILALFIYQLSYGAPNRVMTPARMYTFGAFLVIFFTQDMSHSIYVWGRHYPALCWFVH